MVLVGERDKDGERRTLSAHRFALLLAAGTLDHQTFGEHHCNETLCVRVDPTHLHPGTQSGERDKLGEARTPVG